MRAKVKAENKWRFNGILNVAFGDINYVMRGPREEQHCPCAYTSMREKFKRNAVQYI